jgi:hypothetical protein
LFTRSFPVKRFGETPPHEGRADRHGGNTFGPVGPPPARLLRTGHKSAFFRLPFAAGRRPAAIAADHALYPKPA